MNKAELPFFSRDLNRTQRPIPSCVRRGAGRACLGFFIASYGRLAEWAAVTDRVEEFFTLIAKANRQNNERPFDYRVSEKGVSLENVTVAKPDGTVLLQNFTLTIGAG